MAEKAVAEREKPFGWPVRVYIEDTDAGGIVFYANYLRFMERARTEFIRSLGFPRIETIDSSVMFVVHRAEVVWNQPARLDDSLMVTASLRSLGRTRMIFQQQVSRGDDLLVEGEVTVACIDRERHRPARIPLPLRTRLVEATDNLD